MKRGQRSIFVNKNLFRIFVLGLQNVFVSLYVYFLNFLFLKINFVRFRHNMIYFIIYFRMISNANSYAMTYRPFIFRMVSGRISFLLSHTLMVLAHNICYEHIEAFSFSN